MANPILNENYAAQERVLQGEPMTVNGTIQITAFLGLLLVASAAFCWSRFTLGYTDMGMMLTAGGAIVGFILALVIAFTRVKYLIPFMLLVKVFSLGVFLQALRLLIPVSYLRPLQEHLQLCFLCLFYTELNSYNVLINSEV